MRLIGTEKYGGGGSLLHDCGNPLFIWAARLEYDIIFCGHCEVGTTVPLATIVQIGMAEACQIALDHMTKEFYDTHISKGLCRIDVLYEIIL